MSDPTDPTFTALQAQLDLISLEFLVARELRDRFSVRSITGENLNQFYQTVEQDRPVKDYLTRWHVIGFYEKEELLVATLHACDRKGMTYTSAIQAIDLEAGLVRTRNSLYQITEHYTGELTVSDIVFIGNQLWHWGVAREFGTPKTFGVF